MFFVWKFGSKSDTMFQNFLSNMAGCLFFQVLIEKTILLPALTTTCCAEKKLRTPTVQYWVTSYVQVKSATHVIHPDERTNETVATVCHLSDFGSLDQKREFLRFEWTVILFKYNCLVLFSLFYGLIWKFIKFFRMFCWFPLLEELGAERKVVEQIMSNVPISCCLDSTTYFNTIQKFNLRYYKSAIPPLLPVSITYCDTWKGRLHSQ